MKLDRFLISYNGNKYLETKKYFKNVDISKYDIIAEPFCGIFGFSRAIKELNPDFKGEFWLNDIDKKLINVFEKIKTNPDEYINDCLKKVEEFKEDKEMSKYFRDNKNDYRKLIFRHLQQTIFNKEQGFKKIKNYKEKIENFNEFYKKVKFSSLEQKEFMESLPKNKKILVFFDPPYFDSNNSDYVGYMDYMNDKNILKDNTYFYIDILEHLKKKEFDCFLIINQISIIDYIYKDFKKNEFIKTYQNTSMKKNISVKRRTNHIIYSNFDF